MQQLFTDLRNISGWKNTVRSQFCDFGKSCSSAAGDLNFEMVRSLVSISIVVENLEIV